SGGEESGSSHTGNGHRPRETPVDATLLDQHGELAAADHSDARGHYDEYNVDVRANDRILVTLTSSAFDPILEVTPPGTGMMQNDDWQGDTTRSQLELIASNAGQMKIAVRSYRR